MSDKIATNNLQADLDVTAGQNVIDSLRRKFASSHDASMQRGDFYMAQSFGLLQRIFPLIGSSDQERLCAMYARARKANAGLKDASHFGARRFFKALKYEHRSKKAFKLVIKASSQVLDDDSMCHITDSIRSRYRTLFSAPIDAAIGSFDQVEVETTLSRVIEGLTSTFIWHVVMHQENWKFPVATHLVR